MAYCEYNPKTNIFSWRKADGSNYIPFLTESPAYYLINGTRYYSESELKRQGLKAKDIKALGEPDFLAPNRRYPGRGYTKLHRVEKVDAVVPF